MRDRALGKTGLQVSAIGLGCAPMMSLSVEAGAQLVRRAVELGINYIDTARSYGETEVMVGQALGAERQRVTLSTKTLARTRNEAWQSIQESLQRLRTDHVDNCHLHALRVGVDIETRLGPGGALEALIQARDEGLVRHIGCTAHTSRALLRALERFDFEIILVPMNLIEREPLAELIPLCQRKGVGVTIMKPLATGLLPAPLALKWLLGQPIAVAVPGPTTLAELEEDAAPLNLDDLTLTPAEQTRVEALAQEWAHRRCRLCAACEPCPQQIAISTVLGSDVMYDHYRTMGPAAFAAAPWSPEAMARDVRHREQLIAKIETCDSCRACEPKCPYGLPTVKMLESMLPVMRDMLRIERERLA